MSVKSRLTRAYGAVALLAFTLVTIAFRFAGADGKWAGTMTGPNGRVPSCSH